MLSAMLPRGPSAFAQRQHRHHAAPAARVVGARPGALAAAPRAGSSRRTSHTLASAAASAVVTEQEGRPVQQQQQQPSPGSDAAAAPQLGWFSWERHWFPAQVLASSDPSRPHAVELLGKQLVLWRDGSGAWRCVEDVCPHRLAPLSEGRVEADGTLQCSYHGWRFDGEGRCTEIPQALDDKAKATACASGRSCVASFPVREAYGLIWVWPTAGAAAAAEAAAAPLPVSKGLQRAWAGRESNTSSAGGTWYRRELPYSWDILVENLTDPSHLPFSHHNLTPTLKREKGAAMPFAPINIPKGDSQEDAEARPAISFAHRAPVAAFDFPSALSPGGRVAFNAPGCVVYEYDLGPSRMQNELLAVPAGPGRSVIFTFGVSNAPRVEVADLVKALFTNPKTLPLLLLRFNFQRQPPHKAHLMSNKLFDQDNIFLHMQDRQMALRGRESWTKDYYCPAPADGLVIAGRRWAQDALRLPLGPAGKPAAQALTLSAEAAAAPCLPKRQLNDRFGHHTRHCTICQAELAAVRRRLAAASAAASALLAAAIGVLAGAVLPPLLGWGGAAGGAAAAGPAAAVAALLGAAAAVAGLLARSAEAKAALFEYVEFSHAANH